MSAPKTPQNLDYWEALALLFPDVPAADRTRVEPPQSWPAWQKQKQQLPALTALDTEVEKLSQGRKDEFAERGIQCPYWTARFHTAVAVGFALEAERKEHSRAAQNRRSKEAQRRLRREIAKLQSTLDMIAAPQAIFENDAVPADEPGIGRPDWQAVGEAQNAATAARTTIEKTNAAACDVLVEAIRARAKFANMLKTESDRRPTASSKWRPWEEGFVQAMGLAYSHFTNQDPPTATTGQFVEFVNAAYAALGGDAIPDKVIRSAIPRIKGGRIDGKDVPGRPKWDRFDRYAYADQKATGEESALAQEKLQQEARRRADQWEAEMREIARSLGLDEAQTNAFIQRMRAGGMEM